MAHIDYENVRRCFRDYVEDITLDTVVDAFESLGRELGELRQMFFYGDWTRRPRDARRIEERGFRAVNVLSKIHGGDRSDLTMSFAIDDQSRENSEITAFLLGTGDADYKEVILRCRERGHRFYVLCFGRSASRELLTMTEGVYPLEVRLDLTDKRPIAVPAQETPDVPEARRYLIQRIDNLEKTLPHVVRNYLRDKILLPEKRVGETTAEVDQFLDLELQEGYLEEYEIDNPRIAGRKVRCLKLKREVSVVTSALLPGGK